MDHLKLYHYTTEEQAKSILSSRQIWLSDVKSLNDGNEIHTRFKIFSSQIESSSLFSELTIRNRELFLEFIVDKLFHNQFFIACFARSEKNKHLWQHYSNGYKGRCLEFEIPLPRGGERIFQLQALPMQYRDYACCDELQSVLNKLVYPDFTQIFQEIRSNRKGHRYKILHKHKGYLQCRDAVIGAFLKYCLGTKSKEFENEQEWRLIASDGMGTWYDEKKISHEHGKRVMKFPFPEGFFTGNIYHADLSAD